MSISYVANRSTFAGHCRQIEQGVSGDPVRPVDVLDQEHGWPPLRQRNCFVLRNNSNSLDPAHVDRTGQRIEELHSWRVDAPKGCDEG